MKAKSQKGQPRRPRRPRAKQRYALKEQEPVQPPRPRDTRAMQTTIPRILHVPDPEYGRLVDAIRQLLDAAEAGLATLVKRESPPDPPADREAG
jgi:hypothetical protein